MEFAKRAWVQIRQQTEGLPKQAWMFLLSMCVILGLVLWLITLYSASGARQPITGFYEPDQQAAVTQSLIASGIDVQTTEGQLTVPSSQHAKARAVLADAGLLASDTSQAYKMLEADNPWATSEQTQERQRKLLQMRLAKTLKESRGVKSATVFISPANNRGFGANRQRPSASIRLQTQGSGNRKQLAISAAGTVAGAIAGLTAENVDVTIDGVRQRAHVEDDFSAASFLEAQRALSLEKEEAIYDLLPRVEGLTVKVAVSMDQMRSEKVTQNEYQEGTLVNETKKNTISREPNAPAEPGIRANAGASIAAAATPVAATHEETDSMTSFSQPLVARTSEQEIGGGKVEQINVTVGVPRSYYAALWRANNPDATDPPKLEDLEALHNTEKISWAQAIRPLTLAETTTPEGASQFVYGEVSINMFADPMSIGLEPQAAGIGGMMDVMDTPAGTMGLASIFGLAALGIIFMMAKKATVQHELPNYEELAGVPASLPAEDELIGEVEEGESELAGVAVDEAALESIQMAEQITELVNGNPEEASQLLNKWVHDDEF